MDYLKRICDDVDKIDSTNFGDLGKLFDGIAADAQKAKQVHDDFVEAAQDLVDIVNSAGLQQLSRGVELGQVSWFFKATDRLAALTSMIASAKSES